MSPPGDRKPWTLIGPLQICPGFIHGLRYPSILFATKVGIVSPLERAKVQAAVNRISEAGTRSTVSVGNGSRDERAMLQWFLGLMDHFNAVSGLSVMDRSLCYRLTDGVAYCAIPTLMRAAPPLAAMLVHLLRLAQSPNDAMDDIAIPQDHASRLRSANFPGSNVPRFVRAAMAERICVQELPGDAIQFGLGKHAVRMDSTVTQFTPAMSLHVARDKILTSQFLARFRLPVAMHRSVANIDAALKAAADIGYPVVVKPCDLDGGRGVRADLRSPEDVRSAFDEARSHSRRIMIEKHFEGRDYRLTVFRGDMVWAIERQPACVIGDGTCSIAELVAEANTDPVRGDGRHARLKTLKLDDEALELLTRDGLSADTVPGVGQMVRLRRAANVSSGGMPVGVTDLVHPDNAALANRAADVLKLDVAGIDLLIPDIGVSWRESGAIICEVNGSPEIGGVTSLHLYPQILRRMLSGDGNISVIAFLGGEQADRLARSAADGLGRAGATVGLHVQEGMAVAGEWREKGTISSLEAGRILGADTVDVMILGAMRIDLVRTGLPVPRIDMLVVADEGVAGSDCDDGATVAAILRAVAPACGEIVTLQDLPVASPVAALLGRLGRPYRILDAARLGAALASMIAVRTPPDPSS